MNDSIRVSAKTVEEAIIEASIQLAVTSDRLEYEIIEKGREGFLGIGARQAVIEARRKIPPMKEEPEKRPETKRVPRSAPKGEKKQPYKKTTAKEEVKKDRRKNEEHVKKEDKSKNGTADNIERKAAAGRKPAAETAKKTAEEAGKAGKVTEEIKNTVENFLKGTLNAMGISAELVSDIDREGALCIDITGENMGVLIGKRGQTLDALQYLANRVANRHLEGYVRVKLDTENYRAKREETLKNLAKNIAYKVKRTRRPVYLEPMNPYERRIIHSALQSDSKVLTHSEGEEPFRKVVVTLKK